ncbi:MAG TPA: transposase, partial [Telluria sp.]|nr:transposase [Telluria sp.]
LVAQPGDYPWSSFSHHIGAKPDPVITDHAVYWALGNTPFDREAAYRELMESALAAGEVTALSEAVLKGWPLGSEKFKSALAKQVRRRVAPAKRGRPAKSAAQDSDVSQQHDN